MVTAVIDPRRHTMRKLPTVVLAAAALVVTAVPAGADEPTPITFTKVAEYTNPCTGEVHEYSYTVNGRLHAHENNLVGVGTSTIETADGYVGTGPDPLVFASSLRISHYTYLLTNEETGSVLRTRSAGVVDLQTGEVLVEEDEWSCVRPAA
jgi:hypothetical protein